MNNKMEEVAKILGVELDVWFDIVGLGGWSMKLTKYGLINHCGVSVGFILNDLLLGKLEIERLLLTNEEKEYLEDVLRPYKNEIEYILKVSTNDKDAFLMIRLDNDVISLPYIKHNHLQYKGLESNLTYTLQELKLFEGE